MTDEPTTPAAKRWWLITPAFARSRGLFLIGVVALALLAGEFGAESVWFLELPLHFHVQMLVMALAGLGLLVWSCVTQRRTARADVLALTAGIVATGYLAAGLWRWLPAQAELIPPALPSNVEIAGKVRLLSFNVYSGNSRHDDVLELIRNEDPDIVLLMELTSRWETALAPLDKIYPFRLVQADNSGNFGIGFWTRLPVRSCRLVKLETATPQVNAVLEVGGQPVRFLGLHPLPPRTGWYAAERNKVFAGVMPLLVKEPQTAIVAGDLNSTRFAPQFLRFCQDGRLYDASYSQAMGRTWPAGPVHFIMGIRIDHVLVGSNWRVRDFRIGPNLGSDHYPLIVDLEFPAVLDKVED